MFFSEQCKIPPFSCTNIRTQQTSLYSVYLLLQRQRIFLHFSEKNIEKSRKTSGKTKKKPELRSSEVSSVGNFSEKNRTPPSITLRGPTKNRLLSHKETSGKMCRHNLTGYISPTIRAKHSLLGRFRSVSLKYNGFE